MKTHTKHPERRLTLRTLALALAACVLPATAGAQGAFPSKPVSMVIPFGPGGATDFIARVMQAKLAENLGQPLVIDNRPGAGGVLATNYVAKSAPDGHIVFQSWDTHTINPLVIKDLPYDTFKDFAPVTLMVRLPLIMGVWAPLPANSVSEFIALAKSQPGKLNFASIGAGSSTRLHAELLNSLAGINVVHIPYKGGGPAMQAMITGEVAYGFFSLAAMKGHFQSGKLKPLAVTGTKRMAELPNVPTMAESGFPGYEAYSWIAIYAPAGTPEAVIARLNKAYAATLNDPEVNKRLVAAGMEVVASSPQQLADFQRKDYEKWVKFTREAKLKFDEK
ncbi:MAG: tripartite tricarboxylate transporter substrate binding protein [Betaproteobacteria bacterium]|nr:tripartite tricarboxylate transporter substrate binding protein [Betaproteobacteria bacterium]